MVSGHFMTVTPQVVKSGENGTFLVNSTHFHENGWNLVKIALFTPKNAFWAPAASKTPKKHWNYNTLSEARRRGPFWALLALFTEIGEKW